MKKEELEKLKDVVSVIATKDKYNTIIFIQGEEAVEPLTILEEHGEKAVAKHLSQWDNGDSDNISENPFGLNDYIIDLYIENAGDYTLAYNVGLGYISLSQKV